MTFFFFKLSAVSFMEFIQELVPDIQIFSLELDSSFSQFLFKHTTYYLVEDEPSTSASLSRSILEVQSILLYLFIYFRFKN